MLLPYIWFSMWIEFWSGRPSETVTPQVRDPLAAIGAGTTSHAALVAATRKESVSIEEVTR